MQKPQFISHPLTSARHSILTRKLHGHHFKLLTVIRQSLKTSSRVKFDGNHGDVIQIEQGVGQGTISSTHNYKVYIDDLINELQQSEACLYIGEIYVGAPFCADDYIMLSTREIDLQAQLALDLRRLREPGAISDPPHEIPVHDVGRRPL